jgi:hypothetical protein
MIKLIARKFQRDYSHVEAVRNSWINLRIASVAEPTPDECPLRMPDGISPSFKVQVVRVDVLNFISAIFEPISERANFPLP